SSWMTHKGRLPLDYDNPTILTRVECHKIHRQRKVFPLGQKQPTQDYAYQGDPLIEPNFIAVRCVTLPMQLSAAAQPRFAHVLGNRNADTRIDSLLGARSSFLKRLLRSRLLHRIDVELLVLELVAIQYVEPGNFTEGPGRRFHP